MAIINQATKELQVKIVYYGPAMCGKTTNLEQIHRITDPAGANRLIRREITSSSDGQASGGQGKSLIIDRFAK